MSRSAETNRIVTSLRNVTLEEIEEAIEDDMGWCVDCEQFTTGCVEPDARRYICEICGRDSVYGAEEMLIYLG